MQAPRSQTVPGMATQTQAPLPPPSMGQYLAPGISQPGSPANSGENSSRIDPTQIPRPQTSSIVINFETRVDGQAALPPVCCIPFTTFEFEGELSCLFIKSDFLYFVKSATSNFIVRDMGNCSPRYMRSTLNQV